MKREGPRKACRICYKMSPNAAKTCFFCSFDFYNAFDKRAHNEADHKRQVGRTDSHGI